MPEYCTLETLRQLRKAAKLSQKEVAKIFGVRRRTVVDWELGNHNPDIVNRHRFIRYLLDRLKL